MSMKKTVVSASEAQKDAWWKKDASALGNVEEKQIQQITFTLGNFDDVNRTFQAIASTPIVDRQGDSIDQSGWVLDNFIKNPVVPWAHDYYTPPVARATEIGVNKQGYLQFTYQAPPEGVYELADTVWNLYRNQFMFAFSVGFIPQDYEGNYANGFEFTQCELLEISAVVVPANPQAVALAYKMDVISERQAKALRGKMVSATKALDEALNITDKKDEKKVSKKQEELSDDIIEETTEKTERVGDHEITTRKTIKKIKAAKGAIADELEDEATAQSKYELMRDVYDIWWAFTDVWYDSNTPASDFGTLLKELAGLLVQVANGDDVVPANDNDDNELDLSPLLTTLQNGVDADKVKELAALLLSKGASTDTEGLTNETNIKDNIDMTKSQKDAKTVEKSGSVMSSEDKDQLLAIHKDIDGMQKSMGAYQTKMEAHKVALAKMAGSQPTQTDDPADTEDATKPEAADQDKKDAKKTAVDKDVTVNVEDEGDKETEVEVTTPVEEPAEDESSDKQEEKTKGKQGEVKSAVTTDDGADHKDEDDDVDPDNLTDEQAEEVLKAVNEALEELKTEKGDEE